MLGYDRERSRLSSRLQTGPILFVKPGGSSVPGNNCVDRDIELLHLIGEVKAQRGERRLGRHIRHFHAVRPERGIASSMGMIDYPTAHHIDNASLTFLDHRPNEPSDNFQGTEHINLE